MLTIFVGDIKLFSRFVIEKYGRIKKCFGCREGEQCVYTLYTSLMFVEFRFCYQRFIVKSSNID